MKRRIFTLEEAIALLPWLESKLQELDPIRGGLDRLQEQLSDLFRQSRSNGKTRIEAEIHQAQKEMDEARSKVAEIVQEINDNGIIVRDANIGLVDFPALRDQTEVFLCWVRGEGSIGYWHGANEGYMSRKPL